MLVKVIEGFNAKERDLKWVEVGDELEVTEERYEILSNPAKNKYNKVFVEKIEVAIDNGANENKKPKRAKKDDQGNKQSG